MATSGFNAGTTITSLPPKGDLVQTLAGLSGCAPQTVAFGTEGPFFQSLGMETVVFGAGSIDQAHQPEEYLRMDRIAPTMDLLEKMIGEFCL